MHKGFRSLMPVAAILLATSVPTVGGAGAQPGPRGQSLNQGQSGEVRRVRVGETVEIRLTVGGGTGLSWVPTQGARQLTDAGRIQTGGEGRDRRVGRPEVQRFLFRARSPGRYPLRFSLDQPWARGTKGYRIVTFTIIVVGYER